MAKTKFVEFNEKENVLICRGNWILLHFNQIKKALFSINIPQHKKILIDGKLITKMDSGTAWLLYQWTEKLLEKKIKFEFIHFSDQHQKLLTIAEKQKISNQDLKPPHSLHWIAQLGKFSIEQVKELNDFLSFIGYLAFEMLRILFSPKHWRINTIFSTINTTGTQALPIIALLSFMIGVVITYQMGNQLRTYGANVFIVNLLGLSVLREFGPLLTAIMISGRTGSSFTAQLGIMKINQEIDALNTMGISSAEILLIPRLIGLMIVLPLLTIWADIFGVLGGMLMANNVLNITAYEFLTRFQREIPLRSLWIGLGKAPIFAFVIATIGCFQGMKVKGSSESVGFRTTRSVVLSIFFIIIIDAGFSVLLSEFKL